MQTVSLFFSNKDRNFDFFSRILAFKTITKSSIFLSIISSIISLILSVTLAIIINFLFSKNDLDKILLKKLSLFFRTSLSS